MNDELLLVEQAWHDEIVKPYMNKCDKTTLSQPYCMGVTQEYIRSKKRIMIIGQEPLDLDPYSDPFDISEIQTWSIKYQEKQLFNKGNEEKNSSPFWTIFREVLEMGATPCWNNIDNIHRLKNGLTIALTVKAEKELNKPFGVGEKTLIQKQIEIAKPNMVWFVTGPHYYKSMSWGLQIESELLKEYSPSLERLVVQLPPLLGDDIKVFWSYHPNYLNFKSSRKSTVEKIICRVFD